MGSKSAVEFGDFQTPRQLAVQVCALLSSRGIKPESVVEPTCGVGRFLMAALAAFPEVSAAVGADINPAYVRAVRSALEAESPGGMVERVRLIEGSFFDTDWRGILRSLPEPVLVVGNPPWVTNSGLAAIGSGNVPVKTNFHGRSGIEAITGKSNFDISEWMLIRLLEWLNGRTATVAVLCKTAVARKVLAHAWRQQIAIGAAELHRIDAAAHFGAAVDACLLLVSLATSRGCTEAAVFESLGFSKATQTIGYRDGLIVANAESFDRWRHLAGSGTNGWRSGIKHDCAGVMELRREGAAFRNGLGELVQLEEDYLYPMLKSSDVASGKTGSPRRWMLVPQRFVGEDTSSLARRVPRTWAYLEAHAEHLRRRGSSIYRNRPPFSIFGVGEYSFSPWKVAVSGLYKKLRFGVIGGVAGKPVVLDDTVYFYPCRSAAEAEFVLSLLESEAARGFFDGYVFWDSKRPITVELLSRIDLRTLAIEQGKADEADRHLAAPASYELERSSSCSPQPSLFG